jgi:alpha-glucosidase (family GH31 glycosyl hydrolase)
MPPYWSLGFQLCRYGYQDLDEVKGVVSDMKKYDIPQVSLFVCCSLSLLLLLLLSLLMFLL